MAALHQSPRDIGAHSSEPDDGELHAFSPLLVRFGALLQRQDLIASPTIASRFAPSAPSSASAASANCLTPSTTSAAVTPGRSSPTRSTSSRILLAPARSVVSVCANLP